MNKKEEFLIALGRLEAESDLGHYNNPYDVQEWIEGNYEDKWDKGRQGQLNSIEDRADKVLQSFVSM